jgi:hypothetical protein
VLMVMMSAALMCSPSQAVMAMQAEVAAAAATAAIFRVVTAMRA